MWWVIWCLITLEAKQDFLELITLWNNINWLYSILSCIAQHPVSKRIPMFEVEVGKSRKSRHLHCISSNLCICNSLSPWFQFIEAFTIYASYDLSLARIDSPPNSFSFSTFIDSCTTQLIFLSILICEDLDSPFYWSIILGVHDFLSVEQFPLSKSKI